MCDRDCFNCRYEDCFVDSVSPKEIQSQTDLDKQILFERKSKKRKNGLHEANEVSRKRSW